LAGYTGALFAFYSLVPSVLNWSGAAVLNLSLLSSNLWAALARNIFLGEWLTSGCLKTASRGLDIVQGSL
jgi:solute carrier family 35 protein F1/2